MTNETNVADLAEVCVLAHKNDPNVVAVEFDAGDGNPYRFLTSPAELKALAVRMYAAARAILGESKHAGGRFN